MKRIVIDENTLEKYKLTLQEFLYLLLIYEEVDFSNMNESLENRGLITSTDLEISLTDKGLKRLLSINNSPSNIDYEAIAKKLQEIYPAGKKAGTNCMWRDSTVIIARKLRTLVEKYHCKFTEEQAIKATEDYVKSFNGDYTYMQVLKYFLLKTRTTGDNDRELTSEFMSRLENEGQEDVETQDWNSELK